MCLLFFCVAGSSSGNPELDYHLAVLNNVDGVTGANHFGTEGDRTAQYGVHLQVRPAPDKPRKMKRLSCSSIVGWFKLDAALAARRHVRDVLGPAALEAAEERVRIERAAAAAAAAAAGPPAPPSAFERMAAAQHVAPAEEAAAAADKRAAEARAELSALEQQLEAAAKKVEEAEAGAKQLEEEADDAREAAGLARKRQKAEGDADEDPSYRRWSAATWNKLETEQQKRRTIEVPREGSADPKKAKLPPGDETRGWHKHWRRGIYGALQSWAKGDRGAVVYMLAACAVHFGVVNEVSALLLPSLPKCLLLIPAYPRLLFAGR